MPKIAALWVLNSGMFSEGRKDIVPAAVEILKENHAGARLDRLDLHVEVPVAALLVF